MNVTLKHIRAFLAVAETGSFTRAAQKLHVSQPALTIQIRELENILGGALFERTTRKVLLTQIGRESALGFKSAVGEFDHVVAHARALASVAQERITIACIPSLAGTLIPDVISEFQSITGNPEVTVRDLSWRDVQSAVRSNEVAFGIGATDQDDASFVTTKLITDPLIVILQKQHFLARQKIITIEDVAKFPLILTNPTSSLRHTVDYLFQKRGLLMLLKHEVAQFSSAIGLVRVGQGLTIIPATSEDIDVRDRLVARPISGASRRIVMLKNHSYELTIFEQQLSKILLNRCAHLQEKIISDPRFCYPENEQLK
jgi:DNA-binding transcriptional LysR family regulator